MDQGHSTETNSHSPREEIFRRLLSTMWHQNVLLRLNKTSVCNH